MEYGANLGRKRNNILISFTITLFRGFVVLLILAIFFQKIQFFLMYLPTYFTLLSVLEAIYSIFFMRCVKLLFLVYKLANIHKIKLFYQFLCNSRHLMNLSNNWLNRSRVTSICLNLSDSLAVWKPTMYWQNTINCFCGLGMSIQERIIKTNSKNRKTKLFLLDAKVRTGNLNIECPNSSVKTPT